MPQTCLYFLQKSYWIFTTISHYRGNSAIVQHSTNFATVYSRVTVGGCSVEYEYKVLRQLARVVVHRILFTSDLYDIAAGPHACEAFLKKKFPVHCSLLAKLLGTRFFEYPVAFQPLPFCSIQRYE